MKRDDWMLLSLTFLTGTAIGMYIYVTAFKPTYVPENINQEEVGAEEWSIISKRRGGDYESGYVQPSFRLLRNGDYVYVQGGQGDDSLSTSRGSLPRGLMSDLYFTSGDLSAYSAPVDRSRCASDQGGYDYEYRITLEGRTSILDTCYTALGENSELARDLQSIWQRFEGTDTQNYNSAFDWLEAWINRNLGVPDSE